jgi:hypothetical protein
VSFIKLGRGKSPAEEHFMRLGSLNFKPAEFSTAQASIEFNPNTGALSYLFRDAKIPDIIAINSNIYSLAEAFPGFVYATIGVVKFPTTCSEESDAARKKCLEELPLDGLNSVRLDNLGLHFPYPKSFSLDPEFSVKCYSKDEGDMLIRALPDSIEQIDNFGSISVPLNQQEKTKGLCETLNRPDF